MRVGVQAFMFGLKSESMCRSKYISEEHNRMWMHAPNRGTVTTDPSYSPSNFHPHSHGTFLNVQIGGMQCEGQEFKSGLGVGLYGLVEVSKGQDRARSPINPDGS
jgi:hypothetical protein